jgi:3-oxoacyl-[acyl-carrier-protein] synthase-3
VQDAGIDPGEIDCIILATVTPDTYCPAGAVYVQKQIGASRAFAFDVNAACTGFIYAAAVGTAFVRSGCTSTCW